MKPHQIAITVDSPPTTPPRTSSDFEEINYPSHSSASWSASRRDEELPLHYMTEDTAARRRVPRGPGAAVDAGYAQQNNWEYDDEGKDVYAKAGPAKFSSGRVARRAPPPPPTTFVRFPTSLRHSIH